MQIIESELIIPLHDKPRMKQSLLWSGGVLMSIVGLFLFLLMMASQSAARARMTFAHDPTFGKDAASQWIPLEPWEIGLGLLVLLLYGLVLMYQIRQLRAPSPYIRINHEGIFASRDAFLIPWAEVKELSVATFLGSPYLRIVPWNVEAVARRVKASANPCRRLGISLTLMLFGRSKSPLPLGIAQMVLPVSLQELLSAIQEHFETEVRTYHIRIQNAQE